MTATPPPRLPLAKLVWTDPETGMPRDYVLVEGASATIGRQDDSDVCLREHHVSRQHAIINYRDGIFTITDLGSANGTFVNDRRLDGAFPLASGDVIRLYVPTLTFSAAIGPDDQRTADEQATLAMPITRIGNGRLIITNGPQDGESIPLLLKRVTIGRATSAGDWQVCLQDPSVSRPHARMDLTDGTWILYDLGSANGTMVNGTPVNEKGRVLRDGDVLTFGSTTVLLRLG